MTMAETDAMTDETVLDGPGVDRSHLPLERRIEAILIVADEPQGAVHLATALRAPVKDVKAAIEALRADYDGRSEGPERGF